jgi:hypothetical protein
MHRTLGKRKRGYPSITFTPWRSGDRDSHRPLLSQGFAGFTPSAVRGGPGRSGLDWWVMVGFVKVYVHTHYMHDESFVWAVYANLEDALKDTGCHPHSDRVWIKNGAGGSDRVEEYDVLNASRAD